jgi:hypothetical protein
MPAEELADVCDLNTIFRLTTFPFSFLEKAISQLDVSVGILRSKPSRSALKQENG